MSSYTAWDRVAFIERVGGEEEAERRRPTQMRLRVEDGLAAVAEWESEHGALTDDERAVATCRLDALIERSLP